MGEVFGTPKDCLDSLFNQNELLRAVWLKLTARLQSRLQGRGNDLGLYILFRDAECILLRRPRQEGLDSGSDMLAGRVVRGIFSQFSNYLIS